MILGLRRPWRGGEGTSSDLLRVLALVTRLLWGGFATIVGCVTYAPDPTIPTADGWRSRGLSSEWFLTERFPGRGRRMTAVTLGRRRGSRDCSLRMAGGCIVRAGGPTVTHLIGHRAADSG